jgi:hypothetical protein
MGCLFRLLLYVRLMTELLRYDLTVAILGFRGVHRSLRTRKTRRWPESSELEATVCEAARRIIPFYWKRVRCLQCSVATARVLRAYGAQADVVIGYRRAPFLAHAWVEVGGRIVNDSPAFQRKLHVLERL